MLNCPLVLIDALHFMQDTVRELEGEISRLEKEKANLSVALTNAKSENSDGWVWTPMVSVIPVGITHTS